MANTVGTFWTCAEMVRWLGEEEAADTLMEAVEIVMGDGIKTKDLDGNNRTDEVTAAVCECIEKLGKKKRANGNANGHV